MAQIILASASPRRKELLEQIDVSFEVCPAKGEEIITKDTPEEVVTELSSQKAREVAASIREYQIRKADIMTPQDMIVIGADTIVASNDRILGKPKDEEDAKAMLRELSGHKHQVYTGVTLVFIAASGRTGEHSFFEKTDVYMKDMDEDEIERYVATGEPMDKAGAYGIQGKCAIYIEKIDGDYNNVVGLPIARIYTELKKLGINWYKF